MSALCGCIAFAAACTGDTYRVAVSSLVRPGMQPRNRYVVFPGMSGISPNDLQFTEFAGYLHRALRARGFVAASKPSDADVAIFLSYGVGAPRVVQYDVSYPIYGMAQGSRTYYRDETSYHSTGISTERVAVHTLPQADVIGIQHQLVTAVLYDAYLALSAIDTSTLRPGAGPVEVWRTTVTSTGTGADIRRILPALMAGAMPHLGRPTAGVVDVKIPESSPLMRWIKGR